MKEKIDNFSIESNKWIELYKNSNSLMKEVGDILNWIDLIEKKIVK